MSARIAVSALLLAALGGPAAAQNPAPAAQAPAAPGAPSASGIDTARSILNQEFEPTPGTYQYDPQGRRDPFVSLLKPVSADTGPKTRPPGLRGFLISEVALKGIVKTPKGFTAMLMFNDKSYFVNSGDRLFDGQITSIDATTVTFRQEVTDPLSTVKTREVKKTLYPSEEAR